MATSNTAWLKSQLAARQAEYAAMSATPYNVLNGQGEGHNANRKQLLRDEIAWLMEQLRLEEGLDDGPFEELAQGYT